MKHLKQRITQGNIHQDQQSRSKQSDRERLHAEKLDRHKPIFLREKDIAGEYDTTKALLTTLGGKIRLITLNDLKAFQQNIKTLNDKYQAGVTPKQVISFSSPDDIARANQQIHYAIPVRRKDNIVLFTTNASAESDVQYHYVRVELQNLPKYLDMDITQLQAQRNIANGKVRFECDCGRYQYWYRYLNSIAGTNLGRQEEGYPKIRNPNLHGIACKHILRVMHWLSGVQGGRYIFTEIQKERKSRTKNPKYTQRKNELLKILEQQDSKKTGKRQQIKTPLHNAIQQQVNKLKQTAERNLERFGEATPQAKNIMQQLDLFKDTP